MAEILGAWIPNVNTLLQINFKGGIKADMGSNRNHNRRQHEQAKARAQIAIQMRSGGSTWKVIGYHLGVSAQRAQALASAHSKRKPNGK
jgi:hypothetical protein